MLEALRSACRGSHDDPDRGDDSRRRALDRPVRRICSAGTGPALPMVRWSPRPSGHRPSRATGAVSAASRSPDDRRPLRTRAAPIGMPRAKTSLAHQPVDDVAELGGLDAGPPVLARARIPSSAASGRPRASRCRPRRPTIAAPTVGHVGLVGDADHDLSAARREPLADQVAAARVERARRGRRRAGAAARRSPAPPRSRARAADTAPPPTPRRASAKRAGAEVADGQGRGRRGGARRARSGGAARRCRRSASGRGTPPPGRCRPVTFGAYVHGQAVAGERVELLGCRGRRAGRRPRRGPDQRGPGL